MKSKQILAVLISMMRRFFCANNSPRRKGKNASWENNWRPLFGYSICLTWVLQMGTICWVIWINHPKAEAIIMALVETTSLWSMALGVMGISVVKSSLPEAKHSSTKVTSVKINHNHMKGNNDGRSI